MSVTQADTFCTFFLDRRCFGVDVRLVREIIRSRPMAAVALTTPVIGGLINLRGRVVTAVDLRYCLGLDPRPPEQLPVNVVIRADDDMLSLLVDTISDVIKVDQATYEPPPQTLTGIARSLMTGVYKLPDRLLFVLDVSRLIETVAVQCLTKDTERSIRNG